MICPNGCEGELEPAGGAFVERGEWDGQRYASEMNVSVCRCLVCEMQIAVIAEPTFVARHYAATSWLPEDVREVRPSWSLERCADALHDIEAQFKERITEVGYDTLAALLDDDGADDGTRYVCTGEADCDCVGCAKKAM